MEDSNVKNTYVSGSHHLFEGDKSNLHLHTMLFYPTDSNFELRILVCFKHCKPPFLNLARDVVRMDVESAVRDCCQKFVDTYLVVPEVTADV